MKKSLKDLRLVIERFLLEDAAIHRCMNGSLVPEDSKECYSDICLRIDDAVHLRDSLRRGTANRAYYNGVLADLRKRRRRLSKIYESKTLQNKLASWQSQPHWYNLSQGKSKSGEGQWKPLTDTSYGDPGKSAGSKTATKRLSHGRAAFALRKMLKWYQKNADIPFLKSIPKVHWVGWVNPEASLQSSAKPREIAGFQKFIDLFPPLDQHTVGLSTVGYPSLRAAEMHAPSVGIIIDQHWPVFCYADDAWSNELYLATPADQEFYKNSGLPKRPSRMVDPTRVIFDSEDLQNLNLSSIPECIIDNWSWGKVVLGSELTKEQVLKIHDICDELGIVIYNRNSFKGL